MIIWRAPLLFGLLVFITSCRTTRQCDGPSVEGRRHGLWTCHYRSGAKESEIQYKNGKKEGWMRRWQEDGDLDFENEWKGDQQVGEFKHYHENGALAIHGFYNENQRRHGYYEEFDSNGQKTFDANYSNGLMNGPSHEWDSSGNLIHSCVFVKDKSSCDKASP